MRIGLREANQHFSRAVKAIRAGREVVLTERGRPIAVIKPLGESDPVEAALQRMAAEGRLLRPGPPRPGKRRAWRPIRARGPRLSTLLREDRDAR